MFDSSRSTRGCPPSAPIRPRQAPAPTRDSLSTNQRPGTDRAKFAGSHLHPKPHPATYSRLTRGCLPYRTGGTHASSPPPSYCKPCRPLSRALNDAEFRITAGGRVGAAPRLERRGRSPRRSSQGILDAPRCSRGPQETMPGVHRYS